MSFSAGSPIINLLMSMDWMSTVVVLILLMMSIVCGAVVLQKYRSFVEHKKVLSLFVTEVQRSESLNDLMTVGREFHDTIGGTMLGATLSDLKKMMTDHTTKELRSKISHEEFEFFVVRANQVVDKAVLDQEEYLPLLGTSAAVSPLIGLFGTVWGIIHAFLNISIEKSADLAVVAPGIAEALITTLAGLVVAIPALIFFHYFSNELRKIEQQLFVAVDSMQAIVRKTFVA
jgi:biopolymer transport protein TolQ